MLRAIYLNYLLPMLKKMNTDDILDVAKILIENYLGYTLEKIEIIDMI